MADKEQRETEDRTGDYGGDDGALENERVKIQPGEDPGIVESPPPGEPLGTSEAEHQQERDRETGEEHPG